MIEVFAGIAILCATTKAAGLQNSIAVDQLRKRNASASIFQLDLTDQRDQAIVEQWVESPLLVWIHLPPVCGTASRAREIRRFPGDPLPLRSDLFPEGRDDLDEKDMRRVQIANQLFSFACHIFQLYSLFKRNMGYFGEPQEQLLLVNMLGSFSFAQQRNFLC